ncbi:MAG: hypothetical protein KUG79_03255 [Pseudomonadales bacterium]|nr:hypothetical protein [Pseudomonadales bacterium]
MLTRVFLSILIIIVSGISSSNVLASVIEVTGSGLVDDCNNPNSICTISNLATTPQPLNVDSFDQVNYALGMSNATGINLSRIDGQDYASVELTFQTFDTAFVTRFALANFRMTDTNTGNSYMANTNVSPEVLCFGDFSCDSVRFDIEWSALLPEINFDQFSFELTVGCQTIATATSSTSSTATSSTANTTCTEDTVGGDLELISAAFQKAGRLPTALQIVPVTPSIFLLLAGLGVFLTRYFVKSNAQRG